MGIALASRHLGNADLGRGRYAQAIEWYVKARTLGEQLNDDGVIAGSVSNLGSVAYFQGDYERAEEHWTEAAAFYRGVERLQPPGVDPQQPGRVGGAARRSGRRRARDTRRCWSSGISWPTRSGPPRRSSTSATPSRGRATSPGRGRCWRTGWPACAVWGSSATSVRACTTWRCWPAPRDARRRRPSMAGEALTIKHATDELFDLAQCLELMAGVAADAGLGARAARVLGAAAALRRTIGARPSAGEPEADAIYATVRGVVGDDGLAAGIAEGETWALDAGGGRGDRDRIGRVVGSRRRRRRAARETGGVGGVTRRAASAPHRPRARGARVPGAALHRSGDRRAR